MELRDERLITCIVPQGRARSLMDALREELGLLTTAMHHARGVGHAGASRRGLGEQTEKDILLVLVPAAQAEAAFALLYRRGGLDQPHAGIMFMERARGTPLRLPAEDAEGDAPA